MPRRGTESEFELTTIERLEALGYSYIHGSELTREKEEVVLLDRLRAFLNLRYGDLPPTAAEQVVRRFSRPEGVDTLGRNMAFHAEATRGYELRVEHEDGSTENRHVYPIDWQNPEDNEFLVVNQLQIRGQNDRRPDLVVFINGLPLVVFELKNPWKPETTIEDAYIQITHYRQDIAQLFDANALVVVSDGVETLHGVWSANWEHFAPWKSIDGQQVEGAGTGTMKTLIEGLFSKERLLAYIRDFLVFEVAADNVVKKGAKYHQFFAVQRAVKKTLDVAATPDERRIGVIWHTTGSGKSLSMAFLVGLLRRRPELENPTFVVQVDRTDLDDQLHDQFVAARALVGDVKHAGSTDELRQLLRTAGGEVIFTTIEKFRLKTSAEGDHDDESEHPVLSTRRNLIVIADEAHRSQYGFTSGYARYLAEALPNALRLGFTGTPISFSGANTVEVFGHYIHTYDMRQSRDDRMTVPIYYDPRQIKLHLGPADVDAALAEIASGSDPDELERKKSRWAALAQAAGASDRLNTLARDLLEHYRERSESLDGKAMIVAMTRENCVRLYDALTVLPGCPEVKVVMTGDITKDPEAWNVAGHITTKAQRDAIKKRMIDPGDPLKLVIVCDMWLTGTDIPCLHTLYVDKPMKGHNMIQAISRVNRVFSDKPHGLIVDYIGIGDELRDATATYAQGGGTGDVAPEVSEEARPVFGEALRELRALLLDGIDYGDWRGLSRIGLEDRYSETYGYLTAYDERRDHFLQAEHRLSRAFLLVRHLDDCRTYADEIIFYQRVRKQLVKLTGLQAGLELDGAVRDLVDDSVESEGVVDIFAAAGIDRPDISILDEDFLQTFKNKPHVNLRLQLLEQLMRQEIQQREGRNLAQARSFKELLEQTLQKYHNRLIDAAAVIRAMIEIRQKIENEEKRAGDLGLEEEELAFYDAVVGSTAGTYDDRFLSELIHEVVLTVKRNLRVDWTEGHREDVRAGVRSAVKRVLIRRGVQAEDFDKIVPLVMRQAEASYRDWPLVA